MGSGDIRKSPDDNFSNGRFCEGLDLFLCPMKDIYLKQVDSWVHTLFNLSFGDDYAG